VDDRGRACAAERGAAGRCPRLEIPCNGAGFSQSEWAPETRELGVSGNWCLALFAGDLEVVVYAEHA
jgi:hypothetical protein